MFEVIHSMYDPEKDAGPVTWVDMQLVAVIERLQDKILELEQQVQAINTAVLQSNQYSGASKQPDRHLSHNVTRRIRRSGS